MMPVMPLTPLGTKILKSLGPGELKVLNYLASGYRNPVIAQRMGIETITVKRYFWVLFNKCGVQTRVNLLMFAVRNGMVFPICPCKECGLRD